MWKELLPQRVDGLVPLHVARWNPLAKVGPESIYAHVKEPFEARRVPFARVEVCQVDESHARLREVPLPDIAVGAFEQVPPGSQRRYLGLTYHLATGSSSRPR